MVNINIGELSIVCEWKSRSGWFKHVATLSRNNVEIAEEKVLRVNRTWERFNYETVIKKLLDFANNNELITHKEYEIAINKIFK